MAESGYNFNTPYSFKEYTDTALGSAFYFKPGEGLSYYATLGLCGEAGEFADKAKKVIRDQNNVITEEVRINLLKELGDVLWYVTALASELNSSLQEVAKMNLTKLDGRRERGTLSGSGDNR